MKYLPIFLVLTTFFSVNKAVSQNTVFVKNNIAKYSSTKNEPGGLEIKLGFLGSKFYFGPHRMEQSEFAAIISTNSSAFRKFNTGTNLRLFGNIIAIPSSLIGGMIYVSNGFNHDGDESSNNNEVIFAGLIAAGVIMTTIGGSKMKSSASMYNDDLGVGLNLGLQKHGAGLAIRF